MVGKASYTKRKKTIVYIPLLNEGTPTFRPTNGIEMGDDYYKVLPTKNYNPEDEEWEFPPGTVVKCQKEIREGQEVLIAKKRKS